MLTRFCFLALLMIAQSAFGNTIYVRIDGGTPAQCDGTANVPFIGSTAKHCAYVNPMYVLPPNIDGGDPVNKPLMKGGDTLIIQAGQYPIGEPFGTGVWDSCKISNPWDCHMQPVPSGTAAAPTKIMGANYASCANGAGAPQLYGQGGAGSVINLTGSNYVTLQCLEITDHSNCILKHTDPSVACQTGGLWASVGITDTDGRADNIPSSNVIIQDVNIHGMSKFGALLGNISNYNVNHTKINANGFGGWSTDLDPAYSISSGTNTFSNIEFGWNGCTENYPGTVIWGCWGQSTGGYGDGFGSSSSSDKGTWSFQDVSVHDNTQDGLDFLHADPSAIITFDRVTSQRNAGNQLKANGSVVISNSIVDANCSALQGKGSMVGNNSAGGSTSGDNCRAGGDAVVFSLSSNHTVAMQHDTVISEGSCIITIADISGTSNSTGDATSKLSVTDSTLIGLPGWIFNPDKKQSCLYYWNASSTGQYKTNLAMTSNVTWNTNGSPPSGNLVADPKLANETAPAFDPTPLSGSPLIGKASDGTNIGAVQSVSKPPDPIVCNGGTVTNSVCVCPAGTQNQSGTCTAIPPVNPPTVCIGGTAANGICSCPAGTQYQLGTCTAIPPACKVALSCVNTGPASVSCTASCQ